MQWLQEKGHKAQQALNRKLKVEQHEPHYKPDVTSSDPEGETVPAPLVVLVVFLRISLDTSVIRYVVIVSDCCFTPIEEFSRHIMARTPFI